MEKENKELKEKLNKCLSKETKVCPICNGNGNGTDSTGPIDLIENSDELVNILLATTGILGALLLFTSYKLIYQSCLNFDKKQ